MSSDDQMEFPSLAFPKDRKALRVHEIALKLNCTQQHVLDLITEGALVAIDISGQSNLTDRRTVRIPVEAWEKFLRERRTV